MLILYDLVLLSVILWMNDNSSLFDKEVWACLHQLVAICQGDFFFHLYE